MDLKWMRRLAGGLACSVMIGAPSLALSQT